MRQIRPGDIIYSARHKCLLYCTGRNGGRPHELLGQVLRGGIPDQGSWKIFEATDVQAILTPDGLQSVLPGTVPRTYELGTDANFDDYVRTMLCQVAAAYNIDPERLLREFPAREDI